MAQVPTRRCTRSTQPPAWISDFVSLNIHQKVSYSLDKYMSYDHLSQNYKAYVATMSQTIAPKTLAKASKGPR